MDAISLEIDGDRVRVTRSCYGGNARQVVTVKTDPQVITVRAKAQDPLLADPLALGDGRRCRGRQRSGARSRHR